MANRLLLSQRRSIIRARRTLRALYGAAHRDFDVPRESPQYAYAVCADLHRQRAHAERSMRP